VYKIQSILSSAFAEKLFRLTDKTRFANVVDAFFAGAPLHIPPPGFDFTRPSGPWSAEVALSLSVILVLATVMKAKQGAHPRALTNEEAQLCAAVVQNEARVHPRIRSQLKTIAGFHVQLAKSAWEVVQSEAVVASKRNGVVDATSTTDLVAWKASVEEILAKPDHEDVLWFPDCVTLVDLHYDKWRAVLPSRLAAILEQSKHAALDGLWSALCQLLDKICRVQQSFGEVLNSLFEGQVRADGDDELFRFEFFEGVLVLVSAGSDDPQFAETEHRTCHMLEVDKCMYEYAKKNRPVD
jgi:hypothetical protein